MGNSTKRLIKITGYVLIPIFIIILIFSALSLYYGNENKQIQEANDFFSTDDFKDMYATSIVNNFSINANYRRAETEEGEEYYISGGAGVYYDTQTNVNINDADGIINYLSGDDKNFKYLIINNEENMAFTNVEHTMMTDNIEGIKNRLSQNTTYWNYENGEITTSIDKLKKEEVRYQTVYEYIYNEGNYTVYTSLENNLPYYDQYKTTNIIFDIAKVTYKPALILLPISIIAIIVMTITTFCFIGLKNEKGEVILNSFDRIPLLVAFILTGTLMLIGAGFVAAVYSDNLIVMCTGIITGTVIMYMAGVFTLETLIKRIKSKTLIKSTLTYRVLRRIKNIILIMTKNANITLKLLWIFIVFVLINVICISLIDGIGIIFLIALWIYSFYEINKLCIKLYEIKDAIKQIYSGNTKVHLDVTRYKGDLYDVAVQVNDIAGGLSNAIDEKLKSERLKTELITNVSHDIKTPLTSIINYVDLLKKEELPNEQAREYLTILDNKSQRLKRLTEDLVEASKASSGNIKLNMERLNVNELLKQISGEFEDKFKARKLDEVMSLPEKPVYIKADSRYMYRVLENMYSNISKYAMENTRVYIDVLPNNNKVTIQMKNISKEKLNISTDELMQRFVRGDSSRNTEGSGLGLSIATSLTTLQGGTFNIYLDGDLFKVIIEFNREIN